MKAYSLDLRQKIVNIYAEGKTSQRQLAEQFQVALSFIEKLLKQQRETGSIAPKVRTQQTPTKLNAQQLTVLEQLVEVNNDATLEELRDRLEQKTGVKISRSTVDRMLKKHPEARFTALAMNGLDELLVAIKPDQYHSEFE